MTLSKERVAELMANATPPEDWPERHKAAMLVGINAAELLALLSAYRTREAAIAECEAGKQGKGN